MTEEKNNPQEEEVLKNEETAEETVDMQEENVQEETPAVELTIEEQLTKDLEEANHRRLKGQALAPVCRV